MITTERNLFAAATILLLALGTSHTQFIEFPTNQGVIVGQFLQQRCRHVDGRGYSWTINGTSVDSSHDKVTVMEWGVLLQYGPVVIADDYLQFKCIAFLINGQILSSPVGSLRALILPKVSTPRNRYIFNEGDNIWMNFTVTGYPHPHMFSWQHDSILLKNASHVIIHGGSLYFKQVSRQQKGEYRLTVQSIAGKATGTVYIDIYYNEFLQIPQSISSKVGGIVTFHCRHRFGRGYSWRINSTSVDSSRPRVNVVWQGLSSRLEYGPLVMMDDYSLVYCLAFLSNGRIYTSSPAQLRILRPPTLLGLKEATTKITSQVQISITVSAYPCPSLLWHFNDARLSPMGRISTIDNTTLVIMDVKRTDAGRYTLKAMNEIGEGEWTTELIVEYPPVLSPIRHPPIVAPLGRAFTVPCGQSVEANPWPSFRWKYNGTIYPSTFGATVGEGGGLMLKTVNYRHAGLYTCIACNKIGTSNTTFKLIVGVPPSTPLDFKVHSTSPNWVNLSWSRVIETGDYPLLGYKVSLKPFSEKWPEVQQIVPNDTLSVNVSGLIPSVEYSATVKALSSVSTLTSLPSVLQNFTTQKSAPAVREVLATVHSPATINVSWTLFYTGGSPVDLFSVQYRKYSSDCWRTSFRLSHIAGNVSSVLVRGLEGGAAYVFAVAATSVIGRGEITVSNLTLSHTLGVPGPPTQPTVIGWDEYLAILNFTIPDIGSNQTFSITVTAVLNGSAITATTRNYSEELVTAYYNFVVTNITYSPELQFQAVAENIYGTSDNSTLSPPAYTFVNIEYTSLEPESIIAWTIMGVVDVVTGVVSLVFCVQICGEVAKNKMATAQRVEQIRYHQSSDSARTSIASESSSRRRSQELRRSFVLDEEIWMSGNIPSTVSRGQSSIGSVATIRTTKV